MEKIIAALINRLPSKARKYLTRIIEGEISGRIARGSVWAFSGSIISKSLMLLSTIIIARLLGKTNFGQFGIIQSTISMFTLFASFGLGITATKYIAELRDSDPLQAGNIIASTNMFAGLLGFSFTVLLLIFAPFIAMKIINAPYLVGEIRVGGLILFFSAMNGAQSGALAGFEDFKSIAKINIWTTLIYLPIQALTTYCWGLTGVIIGLGIFSFVQWTFNSIILKKTSNRLHIKIKLTKSLLDFSYLWKFSLPAVLGSAVVMPVMWYMNTIMVSKSNGFNEMAVFNAATQWQNLIMFIPLAIAQISLPLFANNKNNKPRLIKLIKYNVILNLTIALILAVLFTIFSGLIMGFYGNNFVEGKLALIILVFVAVLISVNYVIGQVIASLGKMWVNFLINIIWALVFIYFAILFLNKGWGAIGLSQALFLSYLSQTIATSVILVLYFKNMRIRM